MISKVQNSNMYESLAVMVNEHEYVKRMLVVIRRMCEIILAGSEPDYEDFRKAIDFIRNYTDKYHHGKEENILFERMMQELGSVAHKLIRHGMYVEHDMGRLFVQELVLSLEKASRGNNDAKLDIIANAVSYTHLLYRHIEKENNVVYVYARNNLSKDTMEAIDNEARIFNKEAEKNHTADAYLALLVELENKYLF